MDKNNTKFGEWIPCGDGESTPLMCSVCCNTWPFYKQRGSNYCPNCGASMDLSKGVNTTNYVADEMRAILGKHVTFNIKVTMKERWVDHFCSMLKHMEDYGKRGCSRVIAFYSDGDGDFHPTFRIDRSFESVDGYTDKDKLPVPDVIFDAG